MPKNGWEVLSLQLLFRIFRRTEKDPLDYFSMGIIQKIRFFFYDVEDPAHNQKLCPEMMQKIENQGVWIAKKKRLRST